MQDGESPPKKARRKAPVGSSLGRPAARGEGGAAAGSAGATPGVVQWGMMAGGNLVPAGRPAPAGLVSSAAASADGGRATPGMHVPYAGPDVMTAKNRITSRRRNTGSATKEVKPELAPPMRPPERKQLPAGKMRLMEKKKALATAAAATAAAAAASALAMAQLPPPVVLLPPPRREWEDYTAEALNVGSPREPKGTPPPRENYRSRQAAAAGASAAAVAGGGGILELVGQVLTERRPDTDRGAAASPAAADRPATAKGEASGVDAREGDALAGLIEASLSAAESPSLSRWQHPAAADGGREAARGDGSAPKTSATELAGHRG